MPIFYQTTSGGGGGTTVNTITVEVDFGTEEEGNTEVAVSAAWVTTSMKLVVSPSGEATTDHDPEDYIIEGVYGVPYNISNGVGFTLMAGCNDTTFGKYRFNVYGV